MHVLNVPAQKVREQIAAILAKVCPRSGSSFLLRHFLTADRYDRRRDDEYDGYRSKRAKDDDIASSEDSDYFMQIRHRLVHKRGVFLSLLFFLFFVCLFLFFLFSFLSTLLGP